MEFAERTGKTETSTCATGGGEADLGFDCSCKGGDWLATLDDLRGDGDLVSVASTAGRFRDAGLPTG